MDISLPLLISQLLKPSARVHAHLLVNYKQVGCGQSKMLLKYSMADVILGYVERSNHIAKSIAAEQAGKTG
jgi:hypothetical protein